MIYNALGNLSSSLRKYGIYLQKSPILSLTVPNRQYGLMSIIRMISPWQSISWLRELKPSISTRHTILAAFNKEIMNTLIEVAEVTVAVVIILGATIIRMADVIMEEMAEVVAKGAVAIPMVPTMVDVQSPLTHTSHLLNRML